MGDGPLGTAEYRDRAVCLVFSAACNYRAVSRIALKAFQISISSPSFFRIEHSPTELTNAATCTRPYRADAEQALFQQLRCELVCNFCVLPSRVARDSSLRAIFQQRFRLVSLNLVPHSCHADWPLFCAVLP